EPDVVGCAELPPELVDCVEPPPVVVDWDELVPSCEDVELGCPPDGLWVGDGLCVDVCTLRPLLELTSHGLEGSCEVVCHEAPGGTGDAAPLVPRVMVRGEPVIA